MIPVSVKLLKTKVTLINRDDLKEYLIQTTYDKGKFRVLFLDEKKMFASLYNKEFQNVINNTEIVLCSSQAVGWMIKMLTGKIVPIIMPVTIFLDFMRASDEMNYTCFLFGGDKAVSGETIKRIRKSFSQARIVGNYRSNIKNKEMDDVLTTIRKSAPQIFFVSYSHSFKQEKWISDNQKSFQTSIVLGIDNAFEIIAGKQKMPPLWFQKKGWNGLYHLLTRPYDVSRLFRLAVLFLVTMYMRLFNKSGKN
jgi:N-acetylglucosaminyldiphosphoundecaprenol N-acetyl-beta-D-mannosaminyltransferase